MWFALVLIASLLLAVTAIPKREVEDARAVGLGDNAFPTSKYGDVVPYVFGTCEQKSPIVLWYGHFQPIPQSEEVSTGLFSSKTVITSYRYLIGFDLGICLGPGVLLQQIKAEGGKVVWDGTGAEAGGSDEVYNISIQGQPNMGGGLEFFSGNYDQIASPYITANIAHPWWTSSPNITDYSSYPGVCHISFIQFYIGDDNAIPPRFSFVVKNLTKNLSEDYSVMSNGKDLNPMEVVYTLLTESWGLGGLDSSLIDIDNFLEAAESLYNLDLGMSFILSGEKTIKQVLEECMRDCDGVLYQDPLTDKIKIKLIRDDYDVEELLVLDESNIIGDLDDFGRTTWEETFNQVRVNFQSRTFDYQSQVVVAQDFANINYTGKIKSTTYNAPGIKDSGAAVYIGSKQLELLSSPILKCNFKANRIAKDLRPGDVFILNWGPYNMTNAVMRVVKIDLGTLTNNAITISCVQDRFAKDLVSFQDNGTSEHENIDANAAETEDFIIYEPPLFLSVGEDLINQDVIDKYDHQTKIMILAKAPNEQAVSFSAFMSKETTPDKYSAIMRDQPYTGAGYLEDPYGGTTAGDSGVDTTSNPIIYGLDEKTIAGLVNNETFDDARDGSSLARLASGEIICFVGFTDLGEGRIQLGDVYRAMLNTTLNRSLSENAADSIVYFIKKGSNISTNFFYPITTDETYFKVQTKTPIGVLDIDTISPFTKSLLLGRERYPLPVKYLTVNGSRSFSNNVTGTFTVAWKARSRKDPKLYAYNETYESSFAETGMSYRVTCTGTDPYNNPLTVTFNTTSLSQTVNSAVFKIGAAITITVESKMTSSIPQDNYGNAEAIVAIRTS